MKFTLAVFGLAAIAQAFPTVGSAHEPGQPIPDTPIAQPDSHTDHHWSPDSHKSEKENVVAAELLLQQLQSELGSCEDSERAGIQSEIRSIEHYLKHEVGVTSIHSDPGVISTLTPGRDVAPSTDDLYNHFQDLYKQYCDKPSLAVFLILQNLAGILREQGRPVDIVILAPPTSTFTIGKRQTTIKVGNCDPQQILQLNFEYSLLQILFGNSPPAGVATQLALIQSYLASCGTSVGGIIPATPKPGSPITPST